MWGTCNWTSSPRSGPVTPPARPDASPAPLLLACKYQRLATSDAPYSKMTANPPQPHRHRSTRRPRGPSQSPEPCTNLKLQLNLPPSPIPLAARPLSSARAPHQR
ncbi:atherin-like [Choloepus didactylus]|uniref:atherin-like n=1 Tax=Choloepus didactylus TaxID=27675 RepID=UPI00189D8D9D|nr:atherin-like [Choloepus didactylus]